jgi:hypothetical protein
MLVPIEPDPDRWYNITRTMLGFAYLFMCPVLVLLLVLWFNSGD